MSESTPVSPPPAGRRSSPAVVIALVFAVLVVVVIGWQFIRPHGMTPSHLRKGMSEFTAFTLDGTPWRLAEQKGKVVILNCMATWCPPCKAEMPDLVTLAETFKDQPVAIVSVVLSTEEAGGKVDPVKVVGFRDTYKVSFPMLIPPESSPLHQQVEAFPTTFVLDPLGRTSRRILGPVNVAGLTKDIRELLAEKQ